MRKRQIERERVREKEIDSKRGTEKKWKGFPKIIN